MPEVPTRRGSSGMDDNVPTELGNKPADRVSLLQNAGLFVGQLDHGRLPQGMIPDPGPSESARNDILADGPDSSKSGDITPVWVRIPRLCAYCKC